MFLDLLGMPLLLPQNNCGFIYIIAKMLLKSRIFFKKTIDSNKNAVYNYTSNNIAERRLDNKMEKLKELRKKNNITQEAMARRLGITLSMYEKVEGGRANASAAFMKKIKKEFPNASIDDIFFNQNKIRSSSLF